MNIITKIMNITYSIRDYYSLQGPKKFLLLLYINNNSNIFLNNVNLQSYLKRNIKHNIKINTKFNNYTTQNNTINNSLFDNREGISYFNNNYSLKKSRRLNSNIIENSTISILNTRERYNNYMNYINSFNNRPKLYKSKFLKTISNPNIANPNKRIINKEYVINNNAKNIPNKREIKIFRISNK